MGRFLAIESTPCQSAAVLKGGNMASPSSLGPPSPSEYREFADECLRWADRIPELDQRIALIEIAHKWMRMAFMVEYDQAQNMPRRLPSLENRAPYDAKAGA
jgi:hypothetical protein